MPPAITAVFVPVAPCASSSKSTCATSASVIWSSSAGSTSASSAATSSTATSSAAISSITSSAATSSDWTVSTASFSKFSKLFSLILLPPRYYSAGTASIGIASACAPCCFPYRYAAKPDLISGSFVSLLTSSPNPFIALYSSRALSLNSSPVNLQ